MGYVFNFNDARNYDAWISRAGHCHTYDLGIRLLMKMVDPHEGERLLDIGCGTGRSLEPFLDRGLLVTGLDPSPYMLDIAGERLKNKADLHRGTAEDLPFEDNAFECAMLFTSLEYTQRPAKAIEEACRVAKDRVVIGVYNAYAPQTLARKLKGYIVPSVFSQAHCFGIWELKQILFAVLGEAPVVWRTIGQFPCVTGKIASYVEGLPFVQRSPLGAMIIMEIKPVPKFRTRPLCLKIKKARSYKPVSGFARTLRKGDHGNSILRKAG